MDSPHENVTLGRRVFQWVQVECPHSSQQIHAVCPLETAMTRFVPFEYLPEGEEGDDDRCCKVCFEESLGAAGWGATNSLLGVAY